MREIRMLRSMWRGLETRSRSGLHGHEQRNLGYRQGHDLRIVAPAPDPTAPPLPTARPISCYGADRKLRQSAPCSRIDERALSWALT